MAQHSPAHGHGRAVRPVHLAVREVLAQPDPAARPGAQPAFAAPERAGLLVAGGGLQRQPTAATARMCASRDSAGGTAV